MTEPNQNIGGGNDPLFQGDFFSIIDTIDDPSGDPIDLTNYIVEFLFDPGGDDEFTWDSANNSNVTKTDPSLGKVRIDIPPSVNEQWSIGGASADYPYRVRAIDDSTDEEDTVTTGVIRMES